MDFGFRLWFWSDRHWDLQEMIRIYHRFFIMDSLVQVRVQQQQQQQEEVEAEAEAEAEEAHQK